MQGIARTIRFAALVFFLGFIVHPSPSWARPLAAIAAAFEASATDSSREDAVDIRWTGAAGFNVFFRITRDGQLLTVQAANDSAYLDPSAVPGTVYSYCVSLHDVGSGDPLASACDAGSRTLFRPTQVQASDGLHEDWVEIEWLDNSQVEAGYRLTRSPAGAGAFSFLADVGPGETFHQDVTAVAGTLYDYAVRVFDAAQHESQPGVDVGLRGLVAPPGSVSASDGQYPDRVVITWIDRSTRETGYRVYRDGTLISYLPKNVAGYEDMGGLGVPHAYCVRAVGFSAPDTVESVSACDVGVGGASTLSPPTNVAATDLTFDDRVTVTWNDPGATEDGFAVYRNGILIGNVAANITTFDDVEGQPGTPYDYCVAATNDSGGVSLPVCDEGTRSVVLAATNVSASDGAFEDRVEITWESTSTTTVLFKIYRDGVPIQTVSGNDRMRVDTDVDAGTPHTWCVEALTAGEAAAAQACDTGYRLITAPGSVQATDGTLENHVALTWADNSAVETGYRILRRVAGVGVPLEIGTVGINRESFNDAAIASGVDYEYSVVAFDDLGASAAVTDIGRRTLLAPTEVTAADGLAEFFVKLQWTDNSKSETGYRVYIGATHYGDLPANTTEVDVFVGTGTMTFGVRAFDGLGESDRVDDTGFTTLQAPRDVTASDTYPDRIVVSWVDASEMEAGYRILRNGIHFGNAAPNVTSFTALNPPAGVASFCVVTVGPQANLSASVCDDGQTMAVMPDDVPNRILSETLGHEDGDAGDAYGSSVAMKGDLAAVGALGVNNEQGRVIVFTRETGSDWTEAARFDGTAPLAWLGSSVATDGERIVVGARIQSAAFVIEKVNGAWQMTLLPAPPGLFSNTDYGWDVAIDGTYALVSAPEADPINGISKPRIYVYQKSNNAWSLKTWIEPESGPITSRFGESMDMEGTLLAVGAPGNGTLHLIRRHSVNNWGRIQLLSDPGGLGISVDLDQDRLAVSGGQSVFVYRNPGTGFVLEQKLAAPQGATIGEGVALSGPLLVAGDTQAFNGAGRAFVYARDSSFWRLLSSLEPAGRPAFQNMGGSLAMEGSTLFLGARGINQIAGKVYRADLLAAPGNVRASDGTFANRINVRWSDLSDQENGFRIYRDGVLLASEPAGSTSYDDFEAAAGRSYEYCVSAFSELLGETITVCDFGKRPPDGNITGRVATLAGAGVPNVSVCLTPSANHAIRFDGSAGGISVDDVHIGNSFTTDFWMDPGPAPEGTAQGDVYQTIWSTTNDTHKLLLAYSYEQRRFSLWADGGVASVFVPGANDGWHHYTIRWRNSDGVIGVYVDGLGVAAEPSFHIGYQPPVSGQFRIGSDPDFEVNNFSAPFSGALDELRLWDEFSDHTPIAGRVGLRLSGSEPNLSGSWPFDTGEGIVTDDQSPAQGYGALNDGVDWTTEAPPLAVCAITDLEGNYVLGDLRYSGGTTFRVTPSFPGHEYEPGFKTITLTPGNPVQNEVEFRDVTTFTVAGNIRFKDANCFVGNVEILVDGETRGATDANGDFAISVEPGPHRITPRFGTHTFEPGFMDIVSDIDLSGRNFEDTTIMTLSGRVGGGCNLSIGTIRLKIFPENGCLDPIFVDAQSNYQAPLIPQKYFVMVDDVIGPPPELDRADILRFFQEQGTRKVDLSAENQTLDFIYRAPLKIGVTGLPDPPACATFLDPDRGLTMPAVPIVEQAEHYSLSITVFEDYGSAGLCPVDSGTVTIFDEIIDEEDAPVVLEVRNGLALGEDGRPYQTAGNNPNVLTGRRDAEGNDRSYQKAISFVAEVEGRSPVTRTDWAMVTGYRTRSATFTSVSEDIPLMILRDPPGDGSSAFIEKGETNCTTISNAFLEGTSAGIDVEVAVGFNIEKGMFVFTKSALQAAINAKFQVSFEATQENSVTLCATATERISTSDSDLFIGRDGDVYVGVAMNLVFAKTDILNLDGCSIAKSQGVAMGGDGFESSYLFSGAHIQYTLIPQLEELADLNPEGLDAILFSSAAENWRRQIALNDSLKNAAEFIVNRSFSAGANYDYSEESSRTGSFEWTVGVSTTLDAAAGLKWKTDVSEGKALFTAGLKFQYTRATNREESTTRTTGYTLTDNDIFDYFSVDILEDSQYGTPVFKTVSGRGSCPWEFGTQPRDSAVVTIEPPARLDVDPEGLATFVLNLTNDSPAGETREYFLMPVQTSNPHGASIRVSGGTFIQLPFFITAGQTRSVDLTVARGPVHYDYEDLQLVLIPVCEFDYWRNTGIAQLADTVTFTVTFRAPCSDIALFEPQPGWAYNLPESQSTGNILRLTLDDFSLTVGESDSVLAVGAEYRPVNTEFWLPIAEVRNADVPLTPTGDPKSVEIPWNVSGVPDGSYELRAFTRCQNGRAFSNPATGVIDRVVPRPFGNPQPADSILAYGEDISITFDENVECFTSPGDRMTLNVMNVDGTLDPVDFDVSCNGETFIITPQSPPLAVLEGRTLVARVMGVRDLADNTMAARDGGATEEWRFVVRQNAFAWSQIRVLEEATYRDPGSFFAELVNGRGDDVDYQILDLPAWLTAVPPSGALAAGESEDIQFVVQPDLALGVYTANIRAIIPGPGGIPVSVSPLDIRLEIVCRPATFPFDPALFQYSMTITARVSLGGLFQTDPSDVLAAYVGNELRGFAHPEFDAGLNTTRLFMTVYGNRTSGENVRFRYWDDSACRLYTASNQTVPFTADGQVGFPVPLTINPSDAPADSIQTINVNEGWTWISLNLLSASDMSVNGILADLNPENGDVIKGKTTFSQFGEDTGWIGSLETLDNISGYRLKVSEAGTIFHTGQPFPVTTSIPVVTGWNLVGYLPPVPLATNAALVNLKPIGGDIIKGQYSFAQFMKQGAIEGWFGNLDVMMPGQGYMLYLANASNSQNVLKYPGVAAAGEIAGLSPAGSEIDPAPATLGADGGPDWAFNPAVYQHSMTMTASITLDGAGAGDDCTVGAFVGDELRGVARLVTVPGLHSPLAFLMVHSNVVDGEDVRFKLYTPAGDRTVDVEENVPFVADGVRGTPAAPVVLNASGSDPGPGNLPSAFALGQNYPNPPRSQSLIPYALPVSEHVRIQIYDVAGRLVETLVDETKAAGTYAVTLDATRMTSGIYFYRMEAGSFVRANRFVIAR